MYADFKTTEILSAQWSNVCRHAAVVLSFCRVLCRFSSLWPRWGYFFARYDVQAILQTVVGIPADPAREVFSLLVRIHHSTPCFFYINYCRSVKCCPFVLSIMFRLSRVNSFLSIRFYFCCLNPNVSLKTLRFVYSDYLRPVLINLVYIHGCSVCQHGPHLLQVCDLTVEPWNWPSGPVAEWWSRLQLFGWLFVRERTISCEHFVFIYTVNALTEHWTSTGTVEWPSGEEWWYHPGGEPLQLEQNCQCSVCGVPCRSGILLLRWQKLHHQWRPSEALLSREHFEKPKTFKTAHLFYVWFRQVAEDNYMALLSFFAKFPNFTRNDFYIFGESYGGIYVPTLSLRVLTGTAKLKFKVSWNSLRVYGRPFTPADVRPARKGYLCRCL